MLRDDVRARIRYAATTTETQLPEPKPGTRRLPRRVLATVAVACFTLVCSLGVAAAVFPGFDWFIGRMGEDMRGRVQPVGQTASSEGITMDVLAAVHDGETAIVYLALTDDAKDRVDAQTELLGLDVGSVGHAWAPQVDYDPETGSAIYRMEVHGFTQNLGGEEIPLSVSSILTGVEERPFADTGLTLADVLKANPTPKTYLFDPTDPDGPVGSGYGVSYGQEEAGIEFGDELARRFDAGELPMLERGSAPVALQNANWLSVTAAGVVDGALHLQYTGANEAGLYAHTLFALVWPGVDTTGDYIENGLSSGFFYLGESWMEGDREFYEAYEEVFQLPAGVPPEDIRIYAGGWVPDAHISGNWQATFTLDDSSPEITKQVDIAHGNLTIESVNLSIIGCKVTISGEQGPQDYIRQLEVVLKDGTVVECDSVSSYFSEEGEAMRWHFNRPISLSEVEMVVIDGEQVRFDDAALPAA